MAEEIGQARTYVVEVSSSQEITPSPLAMLAQTCSRIGSDQPASSTDPAMVGKAVSVNSDGTVTVSASADSLMTTTTASPQQIIVASGVAAGSSSSSADSSQPAQTLTISQDGLPVLSNVTLLPHMQSINIGGQEALFIPAQNAETAPAPVQLGTQTTRPVQFSGQSAIPIQPLAQGNPIVVQPNGQAVQQVPSFIQIPVSTANGQTIYQTIQIGTVPIPVNTNPVSIVQTPATQSEGIIAAALADSQVQLKPTKKTVNKPNTSSTAAATITATSAQPAVTEVSTSSVETTHLVPTSNGYMIVPSSGTDEHVAVTKTIGSVEKAAEYTTLDAVTTVDQNAVTNQIPLVAAQTASVIQVPQIAGAQPSSLHLQQDPNDPSKWVIVDTQLMNSSALGATEADGQPKRQRRHACTCPNCKIGGVEKSSSIEGEPKRKQHICHHENCGKVYWKTSHLRAHLRGHTGDRPFICNWPYCDKKFTRSDELQRHRRTHTGEKKFQCPKCDKRFMRSDHLTKHKKTHESVRGKRHNVIKANSDGLETVHLDDQTNSKHKVEVVRVVIQAKDGTVQEAPDQTINCIEIQSI